MGENGVAQNGGDGPKASRIQTTADPTISLESELNTLETKYEDLRIDANEKLRSLISSVCDVRDELCRMKEDASANETSADGMDTNATVELLGPVHQSVLRSMAARCQTVVNSVYAGHRTVHSHVSRVGKSIDKHFVSDYTDVCRDVDSLEACDERRHAVAEALVEHFLLRGDIEAAKTLVIEANLCGESESAEAYIDKRYGDTFITYRRLTDALDRRDLPPVISWCEKHPLPESQLYFQLRKLEFIEKMRNAQGSGGSVTPEALKDVLAASAKLRPFLSTNQAQVQPLLGAVAYLSWPDGVLNSPYKSLFNNDEWKTAKELFVEEAKIIMSISGKSAIESALEVGLLTLPTLMRYVAMFKQTETPSKSGATGADNKEEPSAPGLLSGETMTIPSSLPDDYLFHSVFVCPILKCVAHPVTNPVHRLPCGHLISRDAINQIKSSQGAVKCPYCRLDQDANAAKPVHF